MSISDLNSNPVLDSLLSTLNSLDVSKVDLNACHISAINDVNKESLGMLLKQQGFNVNSDILGNVSNIDIQSVFVSSQIYKQCMPVTLSLKGNDSFSKRKQTKAVNLPSMLKDRNSLKKNTFKHDSIIHKILMGMLGVHRTRMKQQKNGNYKSINKYSKSELINECIKEMKLKFPEFVFIEYAGIIFDDLRTQFNLKGFKFLYKIFGIGYSKKNKNEIDLEYASTKFWKYVNSIHFFHIHFESHNKNIQKIGYEFKIWSIVSQNKRWIIYIEKYI